MDYKLILSDIDEVLLDWGGHFETWYNKTYPLFGGPTPNGNLQDHHDIEEWLNCSIEVTRKLIEQFNQCKDHFPYIEAYPEAVKYVNKLSQEGYKFVAITACSTDSWTHDMRRQNLEKYFPGVFDTVHCSGLGKPKTEYLQRYKPTWWVDDKVKHAEEGGRLGHKSFLVTQHYNVGATLKYSKRVSGWKDIYECIIDENCYRLGWMA
jgi:FMN phosphatase YigB (HAD superfamily)